MVLPSDTWSTACPSAPVTTLCVTWMLSPTESAQGWNSFRIETCAVNDTTFAAELPASEERNWPRHTTDVVAIRSDNRAVVDRMTLIIYRNIGQKTNKPHPSPGVPGSGMELVYHQKCTCKRGSERIFVLLRVLKSAVSGRFGR